jgi:hypothetical protein
MRTLAAVLAILIAAPAAADCDGIAKKAQSVSRADVAPTFSKLIACDAEVAEAHFDDFMKASGDVETLVQLALVTIDAGLYTPVWGLLDNIPDYSARDEVAAAVGSKCVEHSGMLPFIKGAYVGVGDRQFGQWREALRSCTVEGMTLWLKEVTTKPPTSSYHNKYTTVVEAFVRHKTTDALEVLENAATEAGANGGPIGDLLDQMAESLRPEGLGARMSEDDKGKLRDAMGRIAEGAQPASARIVADRLYQLGYGDAAAALLPKVYPDRVQGNGSMLYAVASIEACSGSTVVHYAQVTDKAKRWVISEDVTAPARAFKPRLKCTAEGEWPVMATPEPVSNKADIEAWVQSLADAETGKGSETKLREEKTIALD